MGGLNQFPVVNAGAIVYVAEVADLPANPATGQVTFVEAEGSFYRYSGSAWVETGGGESGPIQTATGTITPEQAKDIVANPVVLVPAQGANTIILLYRTEFFLDWVSVAYVAPSGINIQFEGGSQFYGIDGDLLIATEDTTDIYQVDQDSDWPTLGEAVDINTNLSLISEGSDLTTGNSPIKWRVTYEVVTLLT